MILAAYPPDRCHHCHTTRASCLDKREYRHEPCCARCQHQKASDAAS